ncbi:spermine oxidase-like [Battus philenor]|uniref:spermine oxidase-like n=1 Tax=Battus philenor TaxID=42288 RepID=UPI0035D02121
MDVIVIGCGAAGIAALRRLHDAGLKVLGLEADDRIGGRIRTVEFGECALDLGAAWCHGEKDNIVFELANPLGLLGRPNPDNKWYVLSNGELLPEDKSEALMEALNQEVGKADKNSKKSIKECVRNAAKSNAMLKNEPLAKYFVEWFERNSHVGGDQDPRQGKSLKGLQECWGCEGEFMLNWKGKGFKTILDVLLNKYPDPSKAIPVQIMLKKEVESIKWRSSQPGLKPENSLVQVKCKDGSLFATKSVIVTMSIGVLKERHDQLFNPPLPAEKANAINTLQLCVLDKIYIEFTKPWWPKTPANFSILWRDEDKAKFSDDEKWVTEIYGLYSVEHQPNILLAWIYGTGAKQMEKCTPDQVKVGINKLMGILKKQFDVSPVKAIIRSQWASNALARGSYSYRSVATEEDGGSAIVLSEPLYHSGKFPVVCFAGEATSHHRHSAVHGAIESGFREADRLISILKKK